MKFIVPTHVRVGSTWVCHVLESLLNTTYKHLPLDRSPGYRLTRSDTEKVLECEAQVIKTHDLLPSEASTIVREYENEYKGGDKKREEYYVVAIRRNFFDTFLSQLMYERHVRTAEGLPVTEQLHRVLSRWPEIPDRAFVNFVVETQTDWVREEIDKWLMYNQRVMVDKVIDINYDKVAQNTAAVVDKFVPIIQPTKEQYDKAVEENSFARIKARHKKGFVRTGTPGGWKNFYDQPTINLINNHIDNRKK